ncbi:MAG: PH domain-containing protein [Clostridium sp.]
MFKQFASDALGLSDIGRIISPKDYNKVEADDYIIHEDDEKIFFLIKSKTDEYCFTNLALIHVDGSSAVSKKRLVKRYEYYKNPIHGVMIETAGTIDLDCELKFVIGSTNFSIDIDKNEIEQVKDIYKALIKIGHTIESNRILLERSSDVLNVAKEACGAQRNESSKVSEEFKSIAEFSFNWILKSRETYIQKDYSEIFKKYINN